MAVGRRTDAAPSVRSLLAQAKPEAARRLSPRELRVEAALAVGFLVVAGIFAALPGPSLHPTDAVLLVVIYALLSRIQSYIGSGAGVPTQLALVPMLGLLPPGFVPLAVAAALLLSSIPDVARREHPERLVSAVGDACYALGPAAVLIALGSHRPEATDYLLWAALLISQLTADLAASTVREWWGRGISPSVQLRTVLAVSALDLLLTPVALLAVAATHTISYGYVMVLPLGLLLALLTHDRQLRIDEAVERLAELEEERARLADAIHRATTDPLTGLANRRHLHEALGEEVARSHRYGTPVALVVLDIDQFKGINDTYGHLVGDEVLRRVGATLRRGSRTVDVAARYGGDELMLVVSRADRATALAVADSIRASIAALEFEVPAELEPLRVTASLGVASCPADATESEALIAAADEALYAAKRSGRNRAVAVGPQAVHRFAGLRSSRTQ